MHAISHSISSLPMQRPVSGLHSWRFTPQNTTLLPFRRITLSRISILRNPNSQGTTSVSPNFEVTTLSLGVDMLASALCHMSHAITNRLYKIVDPGFTGLNRFLTPHEVKTIAFSTVQKTFAALDAENRWLSNTTTADITSFANGIEDHASNLPLAGLRSLRIVDNIRYMLGIELMHAAQAVEMRRDLRADNLLKLGKVTGPLKNAYRQTVPYYDADRNLSIDIEKSYQVIKNGTLLHAIEEAESL